MRKTLLLVLVLGLVVGSVATAEAGKKKKKPKRVERVQEVIYDTPAAGSPGVGGLTTVSGIGSGQDEIYLQVEQTDDVSPRPFVRLAWDTDGDGRSDTGLTVCGGKTEEPLEIPGGTDINIFPYVAPGPQCPTGFNTTGKIKFTFSNLPEAGSPTLQLNAGRGRGPGTEVHHHYQGDAQDPISPASQRSLPSGAPPTSGALRRTPSGVLW